MKGYPTLSLDGNDVAGGQAVAPEIIGPCHVEHLIDAAQGALCILVQLRRGHGIDRLIILPLHRQPRRFQGFGGHEAIGLLLRRGAKLVDGDGRFLRFVQKKLFQPLGFPVMLGQPVRIVRAAFPVGRLHAQIAAVLFNIFGSLHHHRVAIGINHIDRHILVKEIHGFHFVQGQQVVVTITVVPQIPHGNGKIGRHPAHGREGGADLRFSLGRFQRSAGVFSHQRLQTALLHDLLQVAVNVGDDGGRRIADGFQGGFQFGQLLVLTPIPDVAEAVIPGFNAVIGTDGIGNAFGLHFHRAAILGRLLRIGMLLRRLHIVIVQRGMGDLVDSRQDGLRFAHALADGNALLGQIKIPVCLPVRHGFHFNRHRRGSKHRLIERVEVLHRGGQLMADGGQRLAIGLRYIKYRRDAEHGDGDFIFFLDGIVVFVPHDQIGFGIALLPLQLLFIGSRSDDLDALFALQHMPLELIPPTIEACHQGGVGLLHIDQHDVVQGVAVKFGRGFEIGRVLIAGEQILDPFFDPRRDLLQPFFCRGLRRRFGSKLHPGTGRQSGFNRLFRHKHSSLKISKYFHAGIAVRIVAVQPVKYDGHLLLGIADIGAANGVCRVIIPCEHPGSLLVPTPSQIPAVIKRPG